jgi:SAM-dependent methyltransferase
VSGVPSARRFAAPLALDPALRPSERLYVRVLGAPVLGLRIRARYLLPLLERLPAAGLRRIGDAGSGRGLFTFHLARRHPAAEVVGMDVDAGQVARNEAVARRLGLTNCRFVVQDVTALPRDASWDLLLSTDNLEHLADDAAQARVFHGALRPGGLLVVHTPHRTRHVFGHARENFMAIEGHVRPGYGRDELAALLRGAGLEVLETAYSYNSVETLANDLSFLVTGGRERRKALYAAVFPGLLALSQLGRLAPPRRIGSGVLAVARRPVAEAAT